MSPPGDCLVEDDCHMDHLADCVEDDDFHMQQLADGMQEHDMQVPPPGDRIEGDNCQVHEHGHTPVQILVCLFVLNILRVIFAKGLVITLVTLPTLYFF